MSREAPPGRRFGPLVWGSVGTLAACVPLYLFVDRPVALWVRDFMPASATRIAWLVSEIGEATPYVLAALLLIAVALAGIRIAAHEATIARLRRIIDWCLYLLVALAASGAVVRVLKITLGRARPQLLFEQGLYGFRPFSLDYGLNAWPSGHAQTAWAVAVVLMLAAPRLRWWLAALAAAVAASRVVSASHYLSDVVGGSLIGIVVTLLLRRYALGGGLRRDIAAGLARLRLRR